MLVLTFAVSGAGNCVRVAGAPYVYARSRFGSFVLPARCPHRGGPLHLGVFEPDRPRLVCPWHERASSVTRAITAGVPVVRNGNRATAVFPHPPGTPHELTHLPLSPDLGGTHSQERPCAQR
ncbi:Rieske 2Fe-2S domain-containing protein [Actinokineospora terrae]|uniref:Rieske [2Fe-2S] domain-containing protein n=1 Tax=Actinokineospora terrae TaxID=155974 RepID=A0A1H9MVC9_9PSEU|nr:Rieske 2Fe-2S domain-containing protein [Actinokineospora terrae]SER27375.1 Rieske [2Fe-2S] domain-containing protein [Actinokineospora terrae]